MQQQTLNKIPCQFVKGVGPRLAKLLEKCGVYTTQDILFHLPFRYQDRTHVTPIRQAKPGEWVVMQGTILSAQTLKKSARAGQFICEFADATGRLSLRFFHISFMQRDALKPGVCLRCYGEVRHSQKGYMLIHPEYQIISDDCPLAIEESLTPIYATTSGLSQHTWRKITTHALQLLNQPNVLPDYLENHAKDFPKLADALRYVHRPPPDADIELLLMRRHPVQLRLALEELLAHHLSLRQRKLHIQQQTAPVFQFNPKLQGLFLKNLSFALTKAQYCVLQEIIRDFQQPHPMLRLVQGDVGSGKTVVAALAALQAVANHYQVALMAPTELLAEQHYRQFEQWFSQFHVPICWLSGQLTLKQRQEVLKMLQTEQRLIAIGTHALFQTNVAFCRLGLVIIDEQHRFGVQQRLALRQKGNTPHQLMMTATPIPRTLAMTAYADLNLSVIKELPPGRTPIKTVVMSEKRREEIITRIQQAHAEKRQIYWVCPLIEESEQLQCQAAQTTALQLQHQLPELRIGLIHGRLKPQKKEHIMREFKLGHIDLLVATTVIEVGVDVPNASVMIIENAERLGLAQLHQLRGRVGRGSVESYCILLYQSPLSELAQARLKTMREHQDGFLIAEKDLTLRGPGELLGTRQTGDINLRVADLQRDKHLFDHVQVLADQLLSRSPEKSEGLIARWLGQSVVFKEV